MKIRVGYAKAALAILIGLGVFVMARLHVSVAIQRLFVIVLGLGFIVWQLQIWPHGRRRN